MAELIDQAEEKGRPERGQKGSIPHSIVTYSFQNQVLLSSLWTTYQVAFISLLIHVQGCFPRRNQMRITEILTLYKLQVFFKSLQGLEFGFLHIDLVALWLDRSRRQNRNLPL